MGDPNEREATPCEDSFDECPDRTDAVQLNEGEGPETNSTELSLENSIDNKDDAGESERSNSSTSDEAIEKKIPRKFIGIAAATVVLAVAGIVAITVAVPSMKYADAKQLVKEGDYSKAIELFEESKKGDFEKYIAYCNGMIQLQSNEYLTQKDAVESFEKSSGIEDSDQRMKEAYYRLGTNRLEAADVSTASDYFSKADGYEDSAAKKEYCNNAEQLMKAEKEYDDGNLGSAQKAFGNLPSDFEYEGISVASRLEALSSNQSLLEFCHDQADLGSWRWKV